MVNVIVGGIYQGIKKFAEEGIEPLEVDFGEYNKKAVREFKSLLL